MCLRYRCSGYLEGFFSSVVYVGNKIRITWYVDQKISQKNVTPPCPPPYVRAAAVLLIDVNCSFFFLSWFQVSWDSRRSSMGFCFQTPAHECSGLPHRSSDMDHTALAMWKHVELSTTGGFRPGAPSLFCFFVSVVRLRFLRFFDFSNTSLSPYLFFWSMVFGNKMSETSCPGPIFFELQMVKFN